MEEEDFLSPLTTGYKELEEEEQLEREEREAQAELDAQEEAFERDLANASQHSADIRELNSMSHDSIRVSEGAGFITPSPVRVPPPLSPALIREVAIKLGSPVPRAPPPLPRIPPPSGVNWGGAPAKVPAKRPPPPPQLGAPARAPVPQPPPLGRPRRVYKR